MNRNVNFNAQRFTAKTKAVASGSSHLEVSDVPVGPTKTKFEDILTSELVWKGFLNGGIVLGKYALFSLSDLMVPTALTNASRSTITANLALPLSSDWITEATDVGDNMQLVALLLIAIKCN